MYLFKRRGLDATSIFNAAGYPYDVLAGFPKRTVEEL
jgi:hypothetical protein